MNPNEVPPPPVELGPAGSRLWRSVLEGYDLDEHEELMLLQAARVADRLDRLAAAAADGPVLVVNGKGDQVASPALVESRLESLTLARLLASMRLPSGENADGALVRPQRRGAVRGTYAGGRRAS